MHVPVEPVNCIIIMYMYNIIMPTLYVTLVHIHKWGTDEVANCTVYMFIQANIHSVNSCRLISTHLECNFNTHQW